MRQLLSILLSLLLPVFQGVGGKGGFGGKAGIGGGAPNAFDFGFDFRSTSGFVTDPSVAAPVLGEAYPHTYTNGVSAAIVGGWENAISGFNDTVGNDARIAGDNQTPGTSAVTFRVDLPSTGLWTIVFAGGSNFSQTMFINFKDNSASFANYTSVSTASNEFVDASGVVRTAAAWPGSNVSITHTFTSTLFEITLGNGTSPSPISHLRVTR